MSSKILYSFLFCFFTCTAFSQAPPIVWSKNYGGETWDGILSMQSTNDGGYIFTGSTSSNTGDVSGNNGNNDCWVVKLDVNRNIEWQKCLGGSESDMGIKIFQTSDGGYITGGFTNSIDGMAGPTHGSIDYWVVKLNSTGGVVWQKAFGGSLYDMFGDIQQTSDGGYIVCGQSESQDGDVLNPHGSYDAWILKLDATGNITWQKSIGGTDYDGANSIRQTSDGGYIFSGGTYSTDGDITTPDSKKIWIVKLNSTGSIEWQKMYGSGNANEYTKQIDQTSDGGFIVLSTSGENAGDVTGNHGSTDFWILKLDNTGSISWQKSLGGSDYEYPARLFFSDDGGYIITGSTYSNDGDVSGNHGDSDGWIVRLSATGELIWQKAIGGVDHDELFPECYTPDHKFLIGGNTRSDNTGDMGTNLGAAGTDDVFLMILSFDPLPVTLNNFNAIAKGEDVVCSWETLQQQNSSYFIIERSDDGIHFNAVEKIPAVANSTLTLHYSYTDKGILPMANEYLYYRLKMVDTDGTFTMSRTTKIKVKNLPVISVYPNPVVARLNIEFTSAVTEETMLTVFNYAGSVVLQQPATVLKGNNSFRINTEKLPAGAYVLMIGGHTNKQQSFYK